MMKLNTTANTITANVSLAVSLRFGHSTCLTSLKAFLRNRGSNTLPTSLRTKRIGFILKGAIKNPSFPAILPNRPAVLRSRRFFGLAEAVLSALSRIVSGFLNDRLAVFGFATSLIPLN